MGSKSDNQSRAGESWIVLAMIAFLTFAGLNSCRLDRADRISDASKNVSVDEALELIEQRADDPNFVVLDVRTPEEHRTGPIRQSVLLDFDAPDFDSQLDSLDRDTTYLVHCASGNHSARVVGRMRKLGFDRIYHMPAGMRGWKKAGMEIVVM